MSLCKKMTNVCNNFIKNEVNCSVDPIMGGVNPLNMNRADSSIVDNTVKFAIPLACDPYNTAKINCQPKEEFYLSKNVMWPSYHGSRDESKTDLSHSMGNIRHVNIESKQEASGGSEREREQQQTALDHAMQKSNALFENPTCNGNRTLVHGGRLQFFKDGKFILELARAQGEKPGWVSVPRKTFWPPSVHSFPATTNKNESSTSLSFSDDNSSIQSSPWQRDHCWKQSAPHQNVSKKMNMYFRRNKNFTLSSDGCAIARKLRRRPHDATVCALPCKLIIGGENDSSRRYFEANSPDNTKESKTAKRKARPRLKVILQRLLDKVPVRLLLLSKTTPGVFNNFATSPIRFSTLQYTHHHLSPRKRILEELGTVSPVVSEDTKTKKKCQKSSGSVSVSTIGLKSQPNKSSSISIYSSTSRDCVNTTLNEMRAISPPTLARYSNHSIHSLLGNSDTCNQYKDDNIHEKRSAELNDILRLKMMLSSSKSPNHKVQPVVGQHSTCLKKRSSTYTVLNQHNPGCTSILDLLSSNSKPDKSSEKPSNPERSAHRSKDLSNSSPPLSGFHPYLSSAKYPPTNVENYLRKDGCEISFIHSKHAKSPSKSMLPAFSNSIQNEKVFQFSQPSNLSSRVTGKGCSNTKFSLTNGILNPNSVNSLEGMQTGQVVPQQNSDEEITTNCYKQTNEQKNKNDVCSDSIAYHIPFDMDNKLLHNSSPVSTSTLYCFYPPQGSPNSNHPPSTYLRPVTYYPKHYGSFTTLRNQIWMHYPNETLPSTTAHKAYNEDNISAVQRITLPSSYAFQPVCSEIPWTSQNHSGSLPGSSLSMNVKEDTNSDIPLNLSKH